MKQLFTLLILLGACSAWGQQKYSYTLQDKGGAYSVLYINQICFRNEESYLGFFSSETRGAASAWLRLNGYNFTMAPDSTGKPLIFGNRGRTVNPFQHLLRKDTVDRWDFSNTTLMVNNIINNTVSAMGTFLSFLGQFRNADSVSVSLYNIAGGNYRFENCTVQDIVLNRTNNVFINADSNTTIDRLSIQGDTTRNLSVSTMNKIKTLYIWGTMICERAVSVVWAMPDTIELSYVKFANNDTRLDLSYIQPEDTGMHYIRLIRTNVNSIDFNYINFRLAWDGYAQPEEKQMVYNQLREKFKKEGQEESYKNIDIEYKQFLYLKDSTRLGRLQNWIDKTWWNYGYNKTMVIENSLWLFFWMLVFNLVFFRVLWGIYRPASFEQMDERLRKKYLERKWGKLQYKMHKMPAIMAYTAYVFWGIKLDLGELKFEKSWWLLSFVVFMIQYISGVVCLAYIVNLIITK